MADPPHCPFAERVEAVMAVIRRHAERTGKKAMFAFNITGEIDEMLRAPRPRARARAAPA